MRAWLRPRQRRKVLRILQQDPQLAVDFLRHQSGYRFGIPPGVTVVTGGDGGVTIQGIPKQTGTYLFTIPGEIIVTDIGTGQR